MSSIKLNALSDMVTLQHNEYGSMAPEPKQTASQNEQSNHLSLLPNVHLFVLLMAAFGCLFIYL